MFSKKNERILFSFFMSAFMAGLMSMVITWLNLGLVENFISIWLLAYWKAFALAFPIVVVIIPYVKKLVNILIKGDL